MFRITDELHRWGKRGRRLRAAWSDELTIVPINIALSRSQVAASVGEYLVRKSVVERCLREARGGQ